MNFQLILIPFQPEFYQVCHTKAEYEEYGPQICRFVVNFKLLMNPLTYDHFTLPDTTQSSAV